MRYFGADRPPLPLPTMKNRFSIGTGACDLVIPREVSGRVSGFHALIERAGASIWIRDQGSKNGTYRSLAEPRVVEIQRHAGESFWLGDVRLFASDDLLDVLRPVFAARMGLTRHVEIDTALESVVQLGERPLALLGPSGMQARALAEAIHHASPRRKNFLLTLAGGQLPPIDHASGGTIFVDMDRVRRLPKSYVLSLLDRSRGFGLVFSARNERVLRAHLDCFALCNLVPLVPVAARRDDVLRLVATHWVETLRTPRSIHELAGIDAITEHDWPGDLDELHQMSARLHAYLVHGGLREAASALGLTYQALSKSLRSIGYKPNHRSRET